MHVKYYLTFILYFSGILAFLYVVFALITKAEYSIKENNIQIYQDNWNSGPIFKIERSLGKTCPENTEPLINNKFPGIKTGCDCSLSNQMSYRDKIFMEKCTDEQLNSNCLDVQEVKESPLYSWKGSTLCVQRAKENFWNLMNYVIKPVSFCPEGYKQCGVFDTLGNVLCLPTDSLCPINYIKIVNKEQSINDELGNLNQIALNDEYTLYYSNNFVNNKIITNIFINLRHFCISPNKGLFGMNHYPLNTLQGDDFCGEDYFDNNEDFFDPRFTIIDQYPSKDFFEENSIDKYLQNTIKYPKPEDDADIYLFSINFFGWNVKCYKNGKELYKKENLLEGNYRLESLNVNGYFIVFTFINFIFVIVIFSIIAFLCDGDTKVGAIFTFLAAKIILSIILIIISSLFIKRNNELLHSFNSFKDEKCAETYTENALDEYYDGLSCKNGFFIATIVLSGVEIALTILYYIFFCLFDDERKARKEK